MSEDSGSGAASLRALGVLSEDGKETVGHLAWAVLVAHALRFTLGVEVETSTVSAAWMTVRMRHGDWSAVDWDWALVLLERGEAVELSKLQPTPQHAMAVGLANWVSRVVDAVDRVRVDGWSPVVDPLQVLDALSLVRSARKFAEGVVVVSKGGTGQN